MALNNRIENGIIAALAMILTVIIFGLYNHFFVLKPLQNELIAQREAIIRLAEIPKYSIANDFEKIKAKDGKITLDLDNNMNLQELEMIQDSTLNTNNNKSFWKFFNFLKKGS